MKRTIINLSVIILLLTNLSGLYAQNVQSLISDEIIRVLNNEISGERAQDYIRNIAHIKRDQASDEYHIAAEWVKNKALEFGLKDAHIEKYPADDDIYYYMQKARGGWDAEFAELWITEPNEEKLTSYAEIPVSLANRSQTCDHTGELVYIGEGTNVEDYEKVDVKGKIVLAYGSASTVASMAVDEFGALGVVHINQRFSYEEPDIVSRVRIFTKAKTFVFSLSHRRGEELRNRLLRGEKIVVRGIVKATIHPGNYENVIATIPGTELSEEEILLTAHLCHYKPGANDNASGSACLLEVARTLIRLIDEGKIDKPKRTIRFLWIPEMSGSIAWAARHPETVSNTIGGINLDMVGQYLNKNNSTFFLHRTPHSQSHYINDILENIIEFTGKNNVEPLSSGSSSSKKIYSLSGSRDAFRYRIADYAGGSDQVIFNDGGLDIPMVFFLIWPDHYYHTSGDKPEICDPTQLKRTSYFTISALVYLMDDSPEKSRRLASEVYSRIGSRISKELKRAFDLIDGSQRETASQSFKEALNIIEQVYKREMLTMESVKQYSPRDKAVDNYIDTQIKNMTRNLKTDKEEVNKYYKLFCNAKNLDPQKMELTASEKHAMAIFPKRNQELKGPLGSDFIKSVLPEGTNLDLNINKVSGNVKYEVLNFINGKNSILDIRNAISAEFEPVPVDWIKEYVDLLAKAGIVN